MEKIAIISDIHSNLEALKSVLDDIKKRNITRIFCLGDIIHKGMHPNECIKLIKQNCEIMLQGNVDYHFTKEHDLSSLNEQEQNRIKWNNEVLNNDGKEYLRKLPFSYEFYLSGNLVRLFHSSPRSVYDYIGIFADFEEWYNMFIPTEKTISDKIADIVIYGHLHTPFINSRYNKTLINTGSVGNNLDYIRNEDKDGDPIETVKATYLILEGEYGSMDHDNSLSYQIVKVPYDIEKELDNNIFNIDRKDYEHELKNGKYRDLSKTYSNFEKNGIDTSKI